MRVLFLRANYGHPDSRCEKEMYSLGRKHDVELLGWDRESTYHDIREKKININGKNITYRHIGLKAPLGKGFKGLFFPLIRFWLKEWKTIQEKSFKYDAIHACDFDTAFPLLFIRKHPLIVYDIFDYYADTHQAPKPMKKLIRRLENKIIRKSDAVIICSEARREQILPEKPKTLAIIHNSPLLSVSSNDEFLVKRSNKQRYKIAYIGVLNEERFLSKIAEVIEQRDDVELHIGGMGVLEEFFTMSAKTHENIYYYGKMDYQSVLLLEKQCDIMTAIYDPSIPNHKYAAPNKFYESLMLKKPLIMMRNTGMDQYVVTYQLGEVIDGGAESFKEGFSRALDHLIAKKEQWDEMGERGFKLYQEQFSWDEMEKRLLKLYDDLELNHNRSVNKSCV